MTAAAPVEAESLFGAGSRGGEARPGLRTARQRGRKLKWRSSARRTMTPLALLAALSGLLVSGARASPRQEKPPPEPGVTVELLEGARQIRAVLPGRLVGYALPASDGGRRRVVLLASPAPPASSASPEGGEKGRVAPRAGGEDSREGGEAHRDPGEDPEAPDPGPGQGGPQQPSPRILLELDLSGSGMLRTLAEDLPPGAVSLEAMDLEGDGKEEIVLRLPGEIRVLRETASGEGLRGESLVTDARLVPGRLDPLLIRVPWMAGSPHLSVPVLGGILRYGVMDDAGGWGLVSRVDLAVDAYMEEGVLKLSSPLVRPVGLSRHDRPLMASGPRQAAGRRLRSVLLDPLGPEKTRRLETWARLPRPEMLMESWFGLLDGAPILMVTTRSAEKLSFFAEKRVRVFPLIQTDRSRTGSEPVMAFDSGANLWQRIHPWVGDLNGDGWDDLVLAYWKGLKDDTVVLDAYVRRPGGTGLRGPGRTRFDVEEGQRDVLSYGRDLDGDGWPELMVQGSRGLQIHRGLPPGRKGGELVEKSPAWLLPMKGLAWQAPGERLAVRIGSKVFQRMVRTFGPPRLADLDGDGRPEIIALRRSFRGRGLVQVTRLGG